jgi:hypothetical protein
MPIRARQFSCDSREKNAPAQAHGLEGELV